jgi:hypothetical protein
MRVVALDGDAEIGHGVVFAAGVIKRGELIRIARQRPMGS